MSDENKCNVCGRPRNLAYSKMCKRCVEEGRIPPPPPDHEANARELWRLIDGVRDRIAAAGLIARDELDERLDKLAPLYSSDNPGEQARCSCSYRHGTFSALDHDPDCPIHGGTDA